MRRIFGCSRRSSDAVVGESTRRHGLGIIEIAPINHNGILQLLMQAIQIQAGEFIPFGEDQKSVGSAGGFGQQADSMEIDNLVQHTWLTTAGTFTLPDLSLGFGASCGS